MALIFCPECGKEISDKAKECPNCGYPISAEEPQAETIANSSKSGTNVANLFFIIAIFAIGIWVICWYYEASHGVKLAEEEMYYTMTHYISTTFILGRMCAITKPICIIVCVIFVFLGVLKKNHKI